MQNTAIQQTSSDDVRRFFKAIDTVFQEKNDLVKTVATHLENDGIFEDITIPLNVRYTLRDGIIWEPYYDKKNDKRGWRPIRRRYLLAWFYRYKHGHDTDFVEELPEGPVRCPAYFLEELWTWGKSINPAIHYLMVKQDYQQFHMFMLLAYMLRPHLEERTMRHEHASTFTNNLGFKIDHAAWGMDLGSIKRFHAEVMQAMRKIQ